MAWSDYVYSFPLDDTPKMQNLFNVRTRRARQKWESIEGQKWTRWTTRVTNSRYGTISYSICWFFLCPFCVPLLMVRCHNTGAVCILLVWKSAFRERISTCLFFSVLKRMHRLEQQEHSPHTSFMHHWRAQKRDWAPPGSNFFIAFDWLLKLEPMQSVVCWWKTSTSWYDYIHIYIQPRYVAWHA